MTEPNPTSPAGPWRPLLTGEAALRARGAVDEIAAALAALSAVAEESPASPRDLSLAGGQAGLALFFSYLDAARPEEGHDETAMAHLERAIMGTAELPAAAGLYSGFAGVAWVLEHLTGRLFDPEGEDPGEEIAAILADHLERSPWRGDYDLISGLVGFGVYALERLPRPGGRECLERIVARLAETAEPQTEGLTWHTSPELIGPFQRDTFPEGYYNLGVAHGVPGVIGFLGEALGSFAGDTAGLPASAAAEARRLLAGAVDWLSAQRLPPGAASLFPYNSAPGKTPTPSRLAWCYGDLGIAAALLTAVRAVGTAPPAWEETALAAARQAAARPAEGAGVIDTGLCHGAAGVGHLFNRLYQASGDPALGEAARAWFDRALAQYQPGEGIGGFRTWMPTGTDRMGELGWGDDPGFLTGAAGIGLALLAATTPVAPDWDRVLLSSIRGTRGAGREEPE
jgi:hypothetical protein